MPRRVNAASTRRHLGVSPLLSLYPKVDDDPKRMATCATSDAARVFEVPASLFANIAPGLCSYSLLTSVSSLECRELTMIFYPEVATMQRVFWIAGAARRGQPARRRRSAAGSQKTLCIMKSFP
jgi:hypothetical protein